MTPSAGLHDSVFAAGLAFFPAATEAGADACLHELVAAQAARTPDAPAIEHEGQVLSYAQLQARAGALAARLRARGVGPEDRVGVLLERSPDAVVAQLAILRAGGAFVPMDPAYPDERLAFLCADAGVDTVVTRAGVGDRLPAGVYALNVDTLSGKAGADPAPPVRVRPENAAYVVYTSGSTGAPKGVVVPHAAVANHACAAAAAYGLGPDDRVLQFASPAFDVALEEVYPTLVRGATVVIRDARAMDSLAAFVDFAGRRGVTVWNLPSPYWHELVGEMERAGTPVPPMLRLLVVGSEAASPRAFRAWRALAGARVEFRNGYGPTECTVTATLYAPPPEGVPADAETVPVGQPVANVRAYVLRADGSEAPVGEAGELYLGGAGVARGYLGRPAVTAERFVPDPFSPVRGARMYRTGDRVRLRNGALVFLGRVDRQVKVRGFRVELEEIEAVLRAHPAVREAAVLLREDAPGRARLVGYAAADGDDGVEPALRAHLAGRLPAYMVPEAIVVLASLPVTAGGKVDRAALPAPAAPARAGGDAPRGGAETRIAEVWQEVLRVDGVGRDEPFLGLGGNSLLAAQAVSRIGHAFGVELSVPALLKASTVAGLALEVERAGTAPRVTPPRPSAAPREGDHPVSTSQARAMFMSRLEPASLAYQFQAALRFRGALDVDALHRALEEIVRRHTIFRSSFHEVDGRPVQRVHPPLPVALPREDLRDVPAGARRAEADRRIRAELERPFHLEHPPLIRWRLFQLEDDVWELAHVEHHIVHDGWSFNVFLADLLEIYPAFAAGRPSPLADPVMQFVDYAAWQEEWVNGPEAAAQLEFWRERLRGAPPLITLPTDRPRPPVQRFCGALRRMEMDPAEADRLRAFCRAHDATLFMAMTAAFALLMQRYSGQDDVCVGSGVANRRWREIEGVVGMFVNTLVLRLELDGDPGFAGLVERTRRTTLDAYARQDLPFDRVVQALAPERSLSWNPLHQVAFSFDDARMPELSVPGLEVTVREGLSNGSAKYDMNVIVAPRSAGSAAFSDGWRAGGLTILWEYDADLFDAATIDRVLEQYRLLLMAAIDEPARPVSLLPLLDEDGRRRVVSEWNRTDAEYPRGTCIHELFQARAARAPGAVAVEWDTGSLTCAELNAGANRLARHLARRGVGPETRVALHLERGPELVTAMLAVLKAGAAYVPLDPGHPAERLRGLLSAAGVALVVTGSRLADALPAEGGVQVLALDAVAAAVAAEPAHDLANRAEPGNLAYVIHTSGSTGVPKPVGVEHRALVNHMAWFVDAFGIGADDRVLQKTPAVFDASVWEFHAPLIAGARLVLARHEGERDPAYLARTARDRKITVLQLVPSMLGALLDEPELAECAALRTLFCGGEALPGALVRGAALVLPGTRLVNLYGPTECCIDATAHPCTADDPERGTAPIGTPVANTRAYVLDAAMEPVPAGVPGELFLGGVQVARGYLGRPAMTAERFVPDPFGAERGGRLYRTGDRVRWVHARATAAVRPGAGEGGADAPVLEYLGRTDAQVKVRGFRIEPGEIEAVLRRHPGVSGCAVAAHPDPRGGVRLAAYVEGGVDADALRAHLRAHLPEHMVPAAFVALERLPRTATGKVDRRALPAPEAAPAHGYAAPRTPAESVLAGIWAQVLGVEQVGVRDSFFEIGGHSLLATRVISRIRAVFGVELPIRAFFEAPTVAAQAGRVRALRAAGEAPLPPLERVGRDRPLPLSFAQERLWFLDRLQPGSAFYNVGPVWRLRGPLDAARLERALGGVVRRHESLRTVFPQVDGSPVQRIVPFAGFALPVEAVEGADPAARQAAALRRVAREVARPFDLAAGPLVRPLLLRLDAEDHVLLVCMHHAVSDEWSIGVLLRETAAAYAGDGDAALPEPTVQYADFAVWQRERLPGEVLDRQLAWWKERLGGAPALLELPTDRPRPAAQSHRGAREPFALTPAAAGAVRALARAEGATPQMVLLAAFQSLLGRYAGTADVVVGTPVSGRSRREVEESIGFFVNTVVVRTDLSGDPPFREVVRRVRHASLGAWEHQEIPFERVVEALHPERTLSHAPIFQVMFVPERADAGEPISGLALERLSAERGTAKFDLALDVAADGDQIRGGLEYATDLFDRATAVRMLEHLVRLLEQGVAKPDAPLSRVELLDGAERARVLDEWGAGAPAHPFVPVHAAVAAVAARTPDAPAVRHGAHRAAYGELDRRANRLAHRLARLGVGPDVRVGICMERGIDMVAAVLAVLKAGGAYVPLDPAYPAPRLASMLEDAAAPVLLTQSAVVDRLPAASGVHVLCVDAETEALAGERDDAPAVAVHPDNLAYVIYTSGSTGTPKGVMLPHAALSNLSAWHGADPLLATPRRTLQFASLSFDVSCQELAATLAYGGELVLVDDDVRRDPDALVSLLAAERVERVFLPFVALQAVAEAAQGRIPALALREIVTAGEQLVSTPQVAALVDGVAGCRLVNHYGPTETHVATAHTLDAEPRAWPALPPIGRPVAGTRTYVLDAALRPLPPGVPGELFIGGVQVARGYLDRPALTAERFLPDPFAVHPGGRLYRTGDRARWRLQDAGTHEQAGQGGVHAARADSPAGCAPALEYLGRSDDQVKIRGVRVEPGEVEAALRRMPGVRDCAVVAREDAPGTRRLVAYVVGDADAAALRAHLRQSVPEPLVPAAFVPVSRLPLTPSGKLDRRALPAPDAPAHAGFVAPRTADEEAVARVWAAVLGVERVGATDNFFDIGGHSLLATRVVARMRDDLGVELPVRALFEAPTVQALAAMAAAAAGSGAPAAAAVPVDAASPHLLLSVLGELSDEELNRLLAENPDPSSTP